MSFKTIYLGLEKADAHRVISSTMDGLRSETVDGSIEYRNEGGMLLAVLSDGEPGERGGATLRYQTSVITPPLAHGRLKAREIAAAVADYRIDR